MDPHRNEAKAGKLAKALAMKYLVELDPRKPHKYNVYALLGDELYALTRQALAFRAARLPPRYLCRLNAFIANICAAVPESPLPGVFSRFRDRFKRDGQPDNSGNGAGEHGGGGGGGDNDDDDNDDDYDDALELPQITEEDLRARLECYICALWAAANHATALRIAKESFKGRPKEAKAAEAKASQALLAANEKADAARVAGALHAFVNACRAQATLAPNLTLLQNVQPKQRLAPLVDSLCCEVLGVPGVDSTGREQIDRLVAAYERQHSFFQSADLNASRVLRPLLVELVEWVRAHEESIVANSATEGMLAGIPRDLRRRLKEQVYYSEEHFMEVVRSFSDQLGMLPLPLHPLLEENASDASQAMKDMHRERITLDGDEVAPLDFPRLLADRVRPLLEARFALEAVEEGEEGAEEGATNGAAAAAAAAGGEGSGGKKDGGSGSRSILAAGSSSPPLGGSSSFLGLRGGDEAGGRLRGVVTAMSEHLVMRVINAASRTTSGGDAFFIVQDLFGGDGVFVKQSAVTAPPIEVTVDGVSGVVVTSRDCYEIYHEQDVVEATEEAHPLMLMHTSMCETIPLPSDDALDPGSFADATAAAGAGVLLGGGGGGGGSSPSLSSPASASSGSSASFFSASGSSPASSVASSMASPLTSLASANAAAGAARNPLASPNVDFPGGGGGGMPPPAPQVERDALSTSLSKLSLGTPLKGAYQSVTSSNQQVRRFLTLNATRPQHATRTR